MTKSACVCEGTVGDPDYNSSWGYNVLKGESVRQQAHYEAKRSKKRHACAHAHTLL